MNLSAIASILFLLYQILFPLIRILFAISSLALGALAILLILYVVFMSLYCMAISIYRTFKDEPIITVLGLLVLCFCGTALMMIFAGQDPFRLIFHA